MLGEDQSILQYAWASLGQNPLEKSTLTLNAFGVSAFVPGRTYTFSFGVNELLKGTFVHHVHTS